MSHLFHPQDSRKGFYDLDLSTIVSIAFSHESKDQTRRFSDNTFTVSSRSSLDCEAGQHCSPLEQSGDMPVAAPRKGIRLLTHLVMLNANKHTRSDIFLNESIWIVINGRNLETIKFLHHIYFHASQTYALMIIIS